MSPEVHVDHRNDPAAPEAPWAAAINQDWDANQRSSPDEGDTDEATAVRKVQTEMGGGSAAPGPFRILGWFKRTEERQQGKAACTARRMSSSW